MVNPEQFKNVVTQNYLFATNISKKEMVAAKLEVEQGLVALLKKEGFDITGFDFRTNRSLWYTLFINDLDYITAVKKTETEAASRINTYAQITIDTGLQSDFSQRYYLTVKLELRALTSKTLQQSTLPTSLEEYTTQMQQEYAAKSALVPTDK